MLTPRAVRNKWFRDTDGVHAKIVDYDADDTDKIDLTDELLENEGISAAWDDVSGPTLGTPVIDGGVAEFTHTKTGSAVLQATTNFTDYLASLRTAYPAADYDITPETVGGIGGVTGDPVKLDVIIHATLLSATGLDGQFFRITPVVGAQFVVGPLAWNAGLSIYDAFIIGTFDAADDGNLAGLCEAFPTYEAIAEYTTYLTKDTRILRVPVRFVDPSRSTNDYE